LRHQRGAYRLVQNRVQPGGTSVVFVTAMNEEGVTSISAEQLIAARSLLSWAQQDLANRAGVSQATVAQLETGARYPTIRVASALRKALELGGVEFTPRSARMRNEDPEIPGGT